VNCFFLKVRAVNVVCKEVELRTSEGRVCLYCLREELLVFIIDE
jgi:hypothetical protein